MLVGVPSGYQDTVCRDCILFIFFLELITALCIACNRYSINICWMKKGSKKLPMRKHKYWQEADQYCQGPIINLQLRDRVGPYMCFEASVIITHPSGQANKWSPQTARMASFLKPSGKFFKSELFSECHKSMSRKSAISKGGGNSVQNRKELRWGRNKCVLTHRHTRRMLNMGQVNFCEYRRFLSMTCGRVEVWVQSLLHIFSSP